VALGASMAMSKSPGRTTQEKKKGGPEMDHRASVAGVKTVGKKKKWDLKR